MRKAGLASLLLVFCLAAAAALDGLAPIGRLALSLGHPALAATLFDDPLWKGVALYRDKRYDAALVVLRKAGPEHYPHSGNALARVGRYKEAVEFYEAHLYRFPHDEAVRANLDLVSALGAIRNTSHVVGGGFPDSAAGGAEAASSDDFAAAMARWRDGGNPNFTNQVVIASREWLATLTDDPGRYLALRFAAEHERRLRLGTAVAPARDPW